MTANAYEALENQLTTLRFYTSDVGRKLTATDFPSREASDAISDIIVTTMKIASPYYVARDIQRVLLDGLDSLPQETKLSPELLPTPAGFVYLEEPIRLPKTASGMDMPLRAFSWHSHAVSAEDETRRSVLIQLFCELDGHSYIAGFGTMLGHYSGSIIWPWDTSLSEVLVGIQGEPDPSSAAFKGYDAMPDRYNVGAAFVASFFHFINQRFVSLGQNPVPRAVRRRLDEQEPTIQPIVRTIVLRAREHTSARETDEHGATWTVRSIRRAHWHHYWCGGKATECLHPGHDDRRLELRWVQATVCGPEGAPLKSPADLFAVTR